MKTATPNYIPDLTKTESYKLTEYLKKENDMNISFSQYTSAGLVRQNNEDSLFAAENDRCALFAVADGMGGHFGGELASGCMTEALGQWWKDFERSPIEFKDCAESLRQVITEVNEKLYSKYSLKGQTCGTTIALLMIYADRYILMNAGDSRVYCMRRGKVIKESVDHVFAAEARMAGEMTESEINSHKNKDKLTSAIGCRAEFKLNVKTAPLTENSSFFICSDGVYKYCSEKDIKKFISIKDHTGTKAAVKALVEENGARDNFSYIKIIVGRGGKQEIIHLLAALTVIMILLTLASFQSGYNEPNRIEDTVPAAENMMVREEEAPRSTLGASYRIITAELND